MNDTQSQTESLLEIIKGIDTKAIMLPEFQRDFRWEMSQTYDLFDSLIRDIFIGTIIYGKPAFTMTLREIDLRPRKGKGSNAPLKTYDYTKEQIVKLAQTQNLRIVLDGQQRITSIYRAILGLDNVYIILCDNLNIDLLQNLTLEDMVQEVKGEESPSAISVRLSDAYETDKYNLDDEELSERFAKTLFARTVLKDASEDQRKIARRVYRRAVYKLIDLYKQQKLVAFYLLDMNLNKFCVFFERSNSRSIQLSFIDILAAKLYYGFNLRKKIEEFESLSKFKLNREIIVRAIAYIVGIERKGPIDIDRNFILENLDADDFQKYWDTTCNLYVSCLNYLTTQSYILSFSWMPSENMLIPLMIFLRQIKSFDQITEEQRKFIEFWYWSSIFANRYSGSSNETIIIDCTALTQVAQKVPISSRNYFIRMRPLITEAEDLFSYTKKSSTIYRGILNLLGYGSQGLRDWNSSQKIDVSMTLEDHHIYPRAYIANHPELADIDQNEAEQLVDSIVNRTLIPKILNIQVGKKSPVTYMSELQKFNSKLSKCLSSHLIPPDMINDKTWDSHFRLFLEERAERIFDLIKQYTTDMTTEMINRFSNQAEGNEISNTSTKPRLKDMIAERKILPGERIYIKKRPQQVATIIDSDTVDYNGKHLSINTWGQVVTGWTSINIYNSVILERTGQPLGVLREK
jgi:hypothetical protein